MDLRSEEGLDPWRVKEVWLYAHHTPDHWVDITESFPTKIAALNAHVSQTAHNAELERLVREWGERNAGVGGLPVGRLAEAFRIVNTD
jgi:LmbE family N-acetylglucosaminyl deacetylase